MKTQDTRRNYDFRRRRSFGEGLKQSGIRRAALFSLAVVSMNGLYFASKANAFSSNIPLRAAIYQSPIPKNEKEEATSKENPLRILNEVADVLQMASRCAIDVVQFPELFLSRDLFSNEESLAPLDRESYALNIVGNLCAELNVACCMGYAEAKHESEGPAKDSGCYSSMAIFHADGSRAGNYRCLHPQDLIYENKETNNIVFEKGHALVEALPITLSLPTRPEAPTLQESITLSQEDERAAKTKPSREVKVGAMCGGDLSIPEHARYLASSGAELLAVSGSLVDAKGSRVAQHIVPARCVENELPLLFSNYVVNEEDTPSQSFVGQSAIVAPNGAELVRAPDIMDGDMPNDVGYFLPCETGGALYAADLEISVNRGKAPIGGVNSSTEQWEITPRIDQLGGTNKENKGIDEKGFANEQSRSKAKGFGEEVIEVLEQSKNKKLRLQK